MHRSAVEGHFEHPEGREWLNLVNGVAPHLAKIVGKLYLAFRVSSFGPLID